MEDNAVSESISIVASTYGCKLSQLCEYEANVYRNEAKWE